MSTQRILRTLRAKGKRANELGIPCGANPYFGMGRGKSDAWRKGWMQAQKQREQSP